MANERDKLNQLRQSERTHRKIARYNKEQVQMVDDYLGKLDRVISDEQKRWEIGRKARIQVADQAKEILQNTKELEGEEEEINKILEDRLKTVQGIFKFESAMTDEEKARSSQRRAHQRLDKQLVDRSKKETHLKKIMTGLDNQAVGALQAMVGGIDTMLGGLLSMLTPTKMIATFFGAIGLGVLDYNRRVDKIYDVFGGHLNQFPHLKGEYIELGHQAVKYNKTIEDVLRTAYSMSSQFGITLDRTKEMSVRVLELARATGATDDTAMKLIGNLVTIGKLDADRAFELAKQTSSLAMQNKVAPVAVLQDLADSQEEMAKYGRDNVEAFMRTAIAARRLGLNIKSVMNSLRGTLDMETSLRAEMEASVLLGRRIDLSNVRRLFLMGKEEDAMKELLKIVGSRNEFDKLNVLQQEALARAVGMTVPQLVKALYHTEQIAEEQGGSLENMNLINSSLDAQNTKVMDGQDAFSTLKQIILDMTEAMQRMATDVGLQFEGMLLNIKSMTEAVNEFVEGWKDVGWWIEKAIQGLAAYMLIRTGGRAYKFFKGKPPKPGGAPGTLKTVSQTGNVSGIVDDVSKLKNVPKTNKIVQILSKGGKILGYASVPLAAVGNFMDEQTVNPNLSLEKQIVNSAVSTAFDFKFTALGATAGSVIPGLGTAAGAGIGAVLDFGYWLFGGPSARDAGLTPFSGPTISEEDYNQMFVADPGGGIPGIPDDMEYLNKMFSGGEQMIFEMTSAVEQGVKAQTSTLKESLSSIKEEVRELKEYTKRLRLETRITNKDLSVVLTPAKV